MLFIKLLEYLSYITFFYTLPCVLLFLYLSDKNLNKYKKALKKDFKDDFSFFEINYEILTLEDIKEIEKQVKAYYTNIKEMFNYTEEKLENSCKDKYEYLIEQKIMQKNIDRFFNEVFSNDKKLIEHINKIEKVYKSIPEETYNTKILPTSDFVNKKIEYYCEKKEQ